MGTINETTGITTAPVEAGDDASASATGTAVGEEAQATGENTAAFARRARATGQDATAIGAETLAPMMWNTVLGYNAGGVNNGANVTLVGRNALGTGDNAVVVGEGAEATAANATVVGWNAEATAQNALALGEGTTAAQPESVAIGDRDRTIAPGRGLVFEEGSAEETLTDLLLDGTEDAGDPLRYDLTIAGQTILAVRAEADGAGGIQNPDTFIPVDLTVDGPVTEVEDVITGDVEVTDGQSVLLRADAVSGDGEVEIDGDLVLTGEVKEGQTL